MLGQPFAQAVPVRPVGNVQIRNHQIELFFFQQRLGFRKIPGGLYAMIAGTQNGADGFQNGVIAIHQEDSPVPS